MIPESAHDGESNRPVALRLNSRKRVCHRTYFSGTSAHHCFSGCRSLATGNYSMSRSVLRTAFRRRPTTRKLDTSYRISMRRRPQPECVLTILHLRLPGRFELPSSRTKRPGPITPAKTSNHWTVNHWTLLRQADRVPRAARGRTDRCEGHASALGDVQERMASVREIEYQSSDMFFERASVSPPVPA
jgi:hypothetical protein